MVDGGTGTEYNHQNQMIEGDPKGPKFLGAKGDTRLSIKEPFSGLGAKEVAGVVSDLTDFFPQMTGLMCVFEGSRSSLLDNGN